MSLRTFHTLFILLAIVGADLFAVWCLWHWLTFAEPLILALGLVSAAGGVGLLVYEIRLMRRMDAAEIR